MTEQEMRELDEWVGKQGKVEGYCRILGYVPPFTKEPNEFAEVKREIERRGWSWRSASCYNGGYHFDIFGDVRWTDGEMESVVIAPKLGEVRAETEELAGCLAFRQAVEAEGSKDA